MLKTCLLLSIAFRQFGLMQAHCCPACICLGRAAGGPNCPTDKIVNCNTIIVMHEIIATHDASSSLSLRGRRAEVHAYGKCNLVIVIYVVQ